MLGRFVILRTNLLSPMPIGTHRLSYSQGRVIPSTFLPDGMSRHGQVPRRLFSPTVAHTNERQSQDSSVEDEHSKTSMFGPHFLHSLGQVSWKLGSNQLTADHLLQMRNEANKIIQQLTRPIDSPSRTIHLEFIAYMVAPYRIMKTNGLPVPQIRQLLEDASQQAMGSVSQSVRRQLDSAPDAYQFIVDVSKDKEKNFFEAPDFQFRRARDTSDSYHLEIHKCWYMEALQHLGAMEIGPCFCSFDKTWYDPIDPRRHGVRFTRPSTKADGSDRCRFNWDRMPVSAGGATKE
jgi:hypothetical protein